MPGQKGLGGYPQVWRILWIRPVALRISAAFGLHFDLRSRIRFAGLRTKMWVNRGVAHRLPTLRWNRRERAYRVVPGRCWGCDPMV